MRGLFLNVHNLLCIVGCPARRGARARRRERERARGARGAAVLQLSRRCRVAIYSAGGGRGRGERFVLILALFCLHFSIFEFMKYIFKSYSLPFVAVRNISLLIAKTVSRNRPIRH